MSRRARGLTLLETAIGITILAGLMLVATQATLGTWRSWETISTETRLVLQVRRGLDAAAVELQMAGNLAIAAGPTGSDMVTFQQPVSVGSSGAVWGAAGQSGWWLRLTVDSQRRLVKQVLDTALAVQQETVLALHVEHPQAGQKALAVTLVGQRLGLTLFARRSGAGRDLARSATTEVVLRSETQ